MAWRGKYKGRGKGTVVYSNLRSKPENATTIQPLPLYPPLTVNPLPIQSDPELDQLLILKREYRKLLQDSEYYFKSYEVNKDIERYSDKYNASTHYDWCPDFMGLPNELKVQTKRKPIKLKKPKSEDKKLVLKVFDELEANETKEENIGEADEEKDEKIKKSADGEGDEEEEEEEDDDNGNNVEYDEENDYVNNYFDNGEDYEDASDNNEGYY